MEEGIRCFAAETAREWNRPDVEEHFAEMSKLGIDAALHPKKYKTILGSLPRPHTLDALQQAVDADPQDAKDRRRKQKG